MCMRMLYTLPVIIGSIHPSGYILKHMEPRAHVTSPAKLACNVVEGVTVTMYTGLSTCSSLIPQTLRTLGINPQLPHSISRGLL